MLLTMMATTGEMWGQTRTEEVAYTLQPASGSNNSYAGNCDITINDIKWNLTGNSTIQPWRIGGKSLNGVDRFLYSKTAISDNITKIEVTHGAASNITINSWTVIVASDASFNTIVSTLTPTFTANSTTTINRPENKDWTGCYYKFVYNVTVSGSSNKFLEFSQAKFYKEVSGNTPYIDADDVEIAYNATEGSIGYTLNNATGNVEAATTSDWLVLDLENITSSVVPFTCSANTAAAARTATVTLSFTGASDKVVTITQAGNPNAPGTQNNPYTVAQARAAIDAGTGVTGVYATGIISQVDSYNSNYSSITYWISSDGTTASDQLEVYSGKGLDNTNFSSINDVEVGATVVVYGTLKKYGEVYEFDKNNYLTSYTAPIHDVEAPTFAPAAGTYAEAQTVTMSCTTEGAAIHYTTDGTEPDGNSDVYTTGITVSETTTFKAKAIKGDDASNVVTATYHINSATAPYTVAQALAFHEYPTSTIWVHGIVSTAPTQAPTNSGQLTYYISDDGTAGENNQLEVYKGLGLNGAAFTAQDDIQVGDIVTITGIVKIYSSTIEFDTNNQLTYFERPATPSITLAQYEYNLNADGGDAVLPVTYTNMPANPQAEVIFYEANGTTTATYDWITASINANYNIAGHINVNEGDARSAYFKVKGKDANNNDVYSNLVTINQAAAGATIEFNNTSMTLAAGGESDRQLSFDYSGLGSNPTFSINYYEQDGTTAATYNHDWLTATIEGDKVNISAVANTGEERKAYFKVYGEGNNTNAESNLVTITQAAYVVDYATLPFSWDDTSTPTGITNNGVGTYSSSPYLKFDGTGDYIILKINEHPGTLSFDIKGNGFGNGSIFKLQTSADGTTYTDLKTYTELGATLNESFDNLGENVRYIKWIYTEKAQNGGNVALGNIALAKYTEPVPSISAEDVNIAYDATGGSIAYTINNPVEGGSMSSMPISGGDWLTVGGPSDGSVALTCEQNTGAERTATVRLTYTYNTNQTVTKDVTVTQAGIPVATYVVNFNLDDGTFVPNEDFPQDVVEKEAGTYTLPSATKAGFDFTGWNDGTDTYEAGAEYTVSDDVNFTAQWTKITTGTISFNNTASGTAINAASVTGDDSMGNTWTITTEGTTSFTANSAYYQVGSGNSPATSITFTMTLPQQKIISAFEAKFGGFNGTVGDIALTVGNTTVGSGSLNGSTDVTVDATTTTEVGTVLTVTVTNIYKGVKCYYISYTLSDAPVVPVIDATAGSALAYIATAGSIIYEIANYEAGTMTATTTADWINTLVVTTPTDEDGEVTFNVTENTSNESRSATVTLSFTYGDPAATVTKDVTVTQNGQPSITVSPATANVAFAGGTPEFAVTYESLEITKADDFDVEFYETPTSTTAGNQPSWITNVAITGNTTDGFTLTVTVAANDGDARDAYLKVYAAGSNDYIYSNLVTINQAAFVQLTTYSLVTSVDQIVSGKHYLIASSATDGNAYAMGGQTSNNRSGVAVTIENGQIAETEGVYEFVINTHESSSKDVEYYTIYDAATPGYLYAASSSKNYLRTETTLDNNGKWTISIATEGSVASVVAQGSNTNKTMKFNSSNYIFSCYASGQLAIYLYVKDNDTDYEYYGTEITYTETSIPDGETITIGTGSVMTVTNNFGNDNPAALVIEDGGQLVFDGTDVKATVKKKTVGESKAEHWYTIASPVNNIDLANITNLTNAATFDLYRYDEATYTWENYKNTAHTDFVTAENGRGYLYYNSDGNELSFAGELNNSASYDLTASGAQMNGLNLIGNPFTQDITLANISLSDDAQISEGFYVLSNNSDWVASVTTVKPCEGFIVKVNKATKATFSKSTGSSKSRANRDYIAFTVANNQYEDVAYAMFSNGLGLDKIDHRNAEIPMVYIPQNGQDYAIATMSDDTEMFNLNFKAMTTGQYTLSVDTKGNYSYLHIYDKMTNEDVDMLLEGEYSFIGSPRDAEDRFVVRLSYRATIDGNDTNNIFAYQSGSDIIVSGNGELQVFDVMGRMVATMHVNGVQTMSTSSLQTGLYIFRLNEKTQKIVVR